MVVVMVAMVMMMLMMQNRFNHRICKRNFRKADDKKAEQQKQRKDGNSFIESVMLAAKTQTPSLGIHSHAKNVSALKNFSVQHTGGTANERSMFGSVATVAQAQNIAAAVDK